MGSKTSLDVCSRTAVRDQPGSDVVGSRGEHPAAHGVLRADGHPADDGLYKRESALCSALHRTHTGDGDSHAAECSSIYRIDFGGNHRVARRGFRLARGQWWVLVDGTNHGDHRSGRNTALLLGPCSLCQKGSTPEWQQRTLAATTAAHSLEFTISDGARAVFAVVVWPTTDASGCPDLARSSHPRSSWNCHIAAACFQCRCISRSPALERVVQPSRSNQGTWLGIEHLDCRLPPLNDPCTNNGEQRGCPDPGDRPDHAGGIGSLNGLPHPLVAAP